MGTQHRLGLDREELSYYTLLEFPTDPAALAALGGWPCPATPGQGQKPGSMMGYTKTRKFHHEQVQKEVRKQGAQSKRGKGSRARP